MRKFLAAVALAAGATLAVSPLAFADTNVDVDVDASHAADHALQHADVLTDADLLNDLGGILNAGILNDLLDT